MAEASISEVNREGDHWRVALRDASGTDVFPAPGHVQEAARTIAQGAKVKMARNSADVAYVAEILIPQAPARTQSRVERLARQIVEAIEG